MSAIIASRSLLRKRGLKLNDPTALWLVHTMRWDLLFFQQFLYSALHGKFHESQTLRAQVVSAVPLEAEVQELAQMVSVLMGHDHFGFPY